MKRRTGRILFATAVAAMALLAPAGTANAGLLSQSAGPCPAYPMSKVFSKWLDGANYTLAPGGSFESADGLTLTGGAKIVAGNETHYVGGTTHKNSVQIPRGGTVTTGPICVGLDKPTVRFFAKRPTFALLPLLTVEGLSSRPGRAPPPRCRSSGCRWPATPGRCSCRSSPPARCSSSVTRR